MLFPSLPVIIWLVMLRTVQPYFIRTLARQIRTTTTTTTTTTTEHPDVVNDAHKYLHINTDHATCDDRVESLRRTLATDVLLYDGFVNQDEHDGLMKEVDRSFRRSKYQYDHWDGVSTCCWRFLWKFFYFCSFVQAIVS